MQQRKKGRRVGDVTDADHFKQCKEVTAELTAPERLWLAQRLRQWAAWLEASTSKLVKHQFINPQLN